MKKRSLLILLTSLTVVALLSGCSKKKTAPSNEPSSPSQIVGTVDNSEEVVVAETKERFSLQDYIPEVEKEYFQLKVDISNEYEYTEREDFVKEYGDPYKYKDAHGMNDYCIEILNYDERDSMLPLLDFYLGGYEFLAGSTSADLIEKLTDYCNGNAIDCTGKDFDEAEEEALTKTEKTLLYSYDDYECIHSIEEAKAFHDYSKAIRIEIIEPYTPKSTASDIMQNSIFLLNDSDQLINVKELGDYLYIRRSDRDYWTSLGYYEASDIFVWDESIGDLVRVKGGPGEYKYGENFDEWYKEYQANHPEGEDVLDDPIDK